MESKEEKNRKLVAQLVAIGNKIAGENRIGKANYVVVPIKNIEAIAKKFNVSVEEAQELLQNYFESELKNK